MLLHSLTLLAGPASNNQTELWPQTPAAAPEPAVAVCGEFIAVTDRVLCLMSGKHTNPPPSELRSSSFVSDSLKVPLLGVETASEWIRLQLERFQGNYWRRFLMSQVRILIGVWFWDAASHQERIPSVRRLTIRWTLPRFCWIGSSVTIQGCWADRTHQKTASRWRKMTESWHETGLSEGTDPAHHDPGIKCLISINQRDHRLINWIKIYMDSDSTKATDCVEIRFQQTVSTHLDRSSDISFAISSLKRTTVAV